MEGGDPFMDFPGPFMDFPFGILATMRLDQCSSIRQRERP